MTDKDSDREYQHKAEARPFYMAYYIIGLLAFIFLVWILIYTENSAYLRDLITVAAVVIGGVGAVYLQGRRK